MDNDEQFAEMQGKNMQLFRKNKADIDFKKLNYDFVKLQETMEYSDSEEQIVIVINNPYQLKIRPEKQIAEVLSLSRSQVKSLLEKGELIDGMGIYHLSEVNIGRIIIKRKVRHQEMKEKIEQVLPLWGIEGKQLVQVYPSAWEINDSYVIKVYDDKKQLERNIKISEILLNCTIPVAKTVLTKAGEKYVENENTYFLLSEKLQGSNISDMKDKKVAWEMGRAIAQLHMAFIKCEKEIEFWDNSLLREMKGWIRENLTNNGWKIMSEEEYSRTVELLESVYDYLPKQLIHRDVNFGNFLFCEGNLSGYIDFDLGQRNIRIFDICYFLAGLLAEETDDAFTEIEWIESVKSVIAGYESIIHLSEKEKDAIPCVMECIEILFVAYFIGMDDTKHANDAYNLFRFIQQQTVAWF